MHNKISQGDIYTRGPSEPSSSRLHSPQRIPTARQEPFQRYARPCAGERLDHRLCASQFIQKKKRQISLLPSIFTKCKYTSHKTKMTKNKSSQIKLELHETNDINKSISAGLPVQKKANINDKKIILTTLKTSWNGQKEQV